MWFNKKEKTAAQLPTWLGVALLDERATVQEREQMVLEHLTGTSDKEQCSATELKKASSLFSEFVDTLKNPKKEVGSISFGLIVILGEKKYWFKTPTLSELDLTFNVVERAELFQKITVQNSPYLLASLFCNIFKKNYKINEREENVTHTWAEAIFMQSEFVDTFALFSFFFQFLKPQLTDLSRPLKIYIWRYQYPPWISWTLFVSFTIRQLLRACKVKIK